MQQTNRRIVHLLHFQAVLLLIRTANIQKSFLQLRCWHRFRRSKKQIARRRLGVIQKRRSSVPVRFSRIRSRPPRHQQLFQSPIFNHRNFFRWHPFVVHAVSANQRLTCKFLSARIVHHRDARWQHPRSYAVYPITFAADVAQELLHHWLERHGRPRAIQRWPKHLRHQRCSRPRFEQHRSCVVRRRRRNTHSHQLAACHVQSLFHFRHARQLRGLRPVRRIIMIQLHPVARQRAQPRFCRGKAAIRANFRAFARQ